MKYPKSLFTFILFLATGCSLFEKNDEKVLLPPSDFAPKNIKVWPYSYEFDVNDQFIYVALDNLGLWRKDYVLTNTEWEYLGFSDTSKYNLKGAKDVSVAGEKIAVAAGGEEVWISNDGGKNWKKFSLNYNRPDNIPYTPWLDNIWISPFDSNVLLANEGAMELFRSIDGGENWQLIWGRVGIANRFSRRVYFHPYKESEFWFYVGNGWVDHGGDLIGFSGKESSIKNEIDMHNWINGMDLSDMTFNLNDFEKIIIQTTKGVFQTSDGGVTWDSIKISNLNPIQMIDFIDYPFSNSKLIINDLNIFRTDDWYQTIEKLDTINYKNRWWDNSALNHEGTSFFYARINKEPGQIDVLNYFK